MIKKNFIKLLILVFILGAILLGWVYNLQMGNILTTNTQKPTEGEKPPEPKLVAKAEKSENTEKPSQPAIQPQSPAQWSLDQKPESAEKPSQTAPAAPAQPQPPAQQAQTQKPEGAAKPPQSAPAAPPAAVPQAPKGPPPMAVEVSKVISRATRSKTPLTGTVLPITEVTVSALMAGQVVEIKVDEGDTVNRGEVLAQLRDIDTRIDVQEAEAAVGKARSELQKQKAGSRGQEVKSKQAEVAEKKAVMEKLKRELERAETLFTQGIMNQSQRDSAEADYKTALSQYESTLASLDMTVEGSRAEDIAVAQSEVTVREAALARKQQMLRDTRILAPISGAVVKKHVEAGEWIDVGGKVVDMVDFSTVRVSIDVPEREIQSVKKGIKAEISVDAYPGTIFSGAVTQVVPAANINNRTFPVLIDIPNADFKLRSGMFARVNLIFAEEASAVLVLKDSILTDSAGKKYIFVVRDNVAHRIDVTTGLTDGNHVEVKGDLKADDLVIITGNEILRDKAPVMVVKQAT